MLLLIDRLLTLDTTDLKYSLSVSLVKTLVLCAADSMHLKISLYKLLLLLFPLQMFYLLNFVYGGSEIDAHISTRPLNLSSLHCLM